MSKNVMATITANTKDLGVVDGKPSSSSKDCTTLARNGGSVLKWTVSAALSRSQSLAQSVAVSHCQCQLSESVSGME